MTGITVRGVPRSLRQDGWWLCSAAEISRGAVRAAPPAVPKAPALYLVPLLIGFIAFADYLFWGMQAGLSLPVFGLAVISAAVLVRGVPAQQAIAPIMIVVLTSLPVIYEARPLSGLFHWGGLLVAAAVVATGGVQSLGAMFQTALRLLPWFTVLPFRDGKAVGAAVQDRSGLARLASGLVAGWMLPIGLGGVFLMLFMAANPIAEDVIAALNPVYLLEWMSPPRLLYWMLIAVLIWPFLRLVAFPKATAKQADTTEVKTDAPAKAGVLWNLRSIRNSLILFNALFAAQTLMDVGYLWGGFALPEGMSYAQYAHRGAYPLVATALLAGGFALASRSHAKAGAMRWLLLGFLGQNLLLVASSGFRLELYVAAYGLTYLRIAAAVWMGLVAFGLCTVIWQMSAQKGNGWLLNLNAAVLVLTLYLACFVNWAGVIAQHNLDPAFAGKIDRYYLCGLPKGAYPVIREWEKRTGQVIYSSGQPFGGLPIIRDWREWDFQSARVLRYRAAESEGT